MKRWVSGGFLMVAYLVIPVYVNWLRHRPRRLAEGTQHIVFAGLLAQGILVGVALLILGLA